MEKSSLVLPKHLRYPIKNPLYDGQEPTPNELWLKKGSEGRIHRSHIKAWYRRSNLPHPPKRWFEVRITKTSSNDLMRKGMWWQDSLWMDKVFWVDQKPYSEIVDGQLIQFYVLDFWECQRVRAVLLHEKHQEPFATQEPSLLVPCECCTLCWDETTQGYSDHIRDRGYREPTFLEKIASEREEEAIHEASKRIIELDPDDPRFQLPTKEADALKRIIGD